MNFFSQYDRHRLSQQLTAELLVIFSLHTHVDDIVPTSKSKLDYETAVGLVKR